ncbi:hypothetical protein [Streptacidiphilus melanogenes]|uniref:hypothetical protein n=1 Tax=Streptacidiphilus melanogenes TaxID=411235 RepID=UPI0005A62F7A|nr:hypothetical protein [Streptacidiphilus melanogenes]
MTAQTTEAVQASVDEAFWDLVLADPELAAAEFAALTHPDTDVPPPDAPPPADGRPGPSPGSTRRLAPPCGRSPTGDHRTVPAWAEGTVRSPPLRTQEQATGVGRSRP